MNDTRCRQCGAPLDALRARLHRVCARPACLQKEDAQAQRRQRDALADRLRGTLVGPLGEEAARRVPVAWIRPFEVRLVELPHDLRTSHQAYLERIVADPASAQVTPADAAPDAGPPQEAETRLCTWCGGRCCRFGGEHDAYLQPAHLRRWQHDHPGSTLADAAAAYAARLPQLHVAGSCLYHGERGCTLDRDMRSDVCNRFACDGLRDLQVAQRERAPSDWLFARLERHTLHSAVHASAQGLQPVGLPDGDPA